MVLVRRTYELLSMSDEPPFGDRGYEPFLCTIEGRLSLSRRVFFRFAREARREAFVA